MTRASTLVNRFDGYNRILMTDSYNISHQRLKVNTDFEVSHIYNRREYRNAGMIMYGLQQIAAEFLDHSYTEKEVIEADAHCKRHNLIFPKELWMRVVNECYGWLPIRVQMVQEGTYVPVGTPFCQIRNTKDGFGELVTWVEAVFIQSWFPCSAATEAFHMRRHLQSKVAEFGEAILWKYHSFGFRGHSHIGQAREAGMAWNLFLFGTDDLHTAELTPDAKVASIPALAHKVTQQFEDEFDCFIHAVDAVAGNENVCAMVIDTYNADNVIDNWVVPITQHAKDKGVHVVFRPDSGAKRVVECAEGKLTFHADWEDIAWQVIRIYRKVSAAGLTNATCIVGEGQSFYNSQRLENYLAEHGVPFNFCFNGIGAGYYKHLERDTLGFAMKTAFSNGEPRAKVVLNSPIKSSLPGIVSLVMHDGNMTVELEAPENLDDSLYTDAYSYGDGIMTVAYPMWLQSQKRAMANVEVKNLQTKIKISAPVVALFEEIEKQHVKMGVA